MLLSYFAARGQGSGRLTRRVLPAVALLVATSVAACNSEKILDVEDVDVATPESLEGVPALAVVHAGAIGDFQVAYSGSSGAEGQVQMSALFTDEYIHAETFPTRLEVDMRSIAEENATMTTIMRDIQRARASADFASGKFEAQAPADVRRAETVALAGFAITIMGENYCSGVPISKLTDAGDIVYGAPRTTAQLWDDAIAKFDTAIGLATARGTAGTAALNLARVGKGRALLNKGEHAAAATAVAGVPTNFVYQIFHSANTGRQNNGVWIFQRISSRFSAADREGINGLPFRSEGDGRTPQVAAGVGFDGSTPMFYQNKYPLRESPVPLATGIEARLIEAEAAHRAGNVGAYALALDAARSQGGVTTPIVPAATADARVTQLFRERAFSLWFTSHRLGDMRRLIRQYGRTADQVFPTGPYFKGGQYGSDVNFIIPLDEKNNPSFQGCLNRNA